MNLGWREDNRYTLLENGTEYFPAVVEAIDAAKSEVLVETFILFDDTVGRDIQQVLIRAAKRGVSVDLLVDGYGSDELSEEFIGAMTEAGVRFHVFDPRPRFLGVRTNVFRRMHRKIVGIDRERAFIGGINFSADHLPDYGPEAKQDYAVLVEGPLAADIADYARAQLGNGKRRLRRRPPGWTPCPPATAAGGWWCATTSAIAATSNATTGRGALGALGRADRQCLLLSGLPPAARPGKGRPPRCSRAAAAAGRAGCPGRPPGRVDAL